MSDTARLARKLNLNHWFVVKAVGAGAFSKVLLVKRKNDDGSDSFFAMKSIRKSNIMAQRFIEGAVKEREILLTMRHPFLLDLHCAFQTQTHLYLIIDFVNGGDLFQFITRKGNLGEKEARFYGA